MERAEFKNLINGILITTRNYQVKRAIMLSTYDPDETKLICLDVAKLQKVPVYLGRPHGLSKYSWATNQFNAMHIGENNPVSLLNHILENNEVGAIYLLEDFIQYFQEPSVRSTASELLDSTVHNHHRTTAKLVVFIDSPSMSQHIPEMLRAKIQVIPHSLPKTSELLPIISAYIGNSDPSVYSKIAASLTGLTSTKARISLREALTQGKERLEVVISRLQALKEEILAKELGMYLLPELNSEDSPIGLDHVWRYLEKNRKRIAISGKDRARGILFVGPPGVGKSMIAKAIGKALKLPVINFEVGRLISSLLGATENNVIRATSTIDSLSPVVVFIDEIEKSLAGAESSGQTDGGTMARSYGTLLSWLNDTMAPVFVIGTANRLDKLGEFGSTLCRKGRFDEIFFVDYPDSTARYQILEKEIQRFAPDTEINCHTLADETDGFSGADLVAIVKEAYSEANFGNEKLGIQHLKEEIQILKPRVEVRKEEFSRLRRWAQSNCRLANH